MFDRSAHLFDLFYEAAGKDYGAESAHVAAHVERRRPDARRLLDVACGTGRHLEHLTARFECVGVDINEQLLAQAARRCPGVRFVRSDMLDLDLDTTFDVVTCLFSSIGYMRTVAELDRAVARMAAHLEPGGLLVVEPCFRPEDWRTDHVGTLRVDRPEISAIRMGHSTRRGTVAVLDLHYLVGTAQGVTHWVERHELGLFSWAEYEAAFDRAGLATEVDLTGPYGRGLLVGTAPGTPAPRPLSVQRAAG